LAIVCRLAFEFWDLFFIWDLSYWNLFCISCFEFSRSPFMKWLGLLWRRVVVPVSMLAVVVMLSLMVFRAYLQYCVKEAIALPALKGIDSLEEVKIGGVNQSVLFRGENVKNPVLLFLHGGPGMPLMPFCHAIPSLEKRFTVVYWDQRGAGKSYSPDAPADSMTVTQLVEDTHELAWFLRNRFNVPKIFLAGHSWGSLVGLLAAARYPEMFYAFAGIGQITDMAQSEALSYQFALKEAAARSNAAAAAELAKIGPPPYDSFIAFLTQRKWIEVFGGDFHNRPGILRLVELAFSSPYYSVTDFWRFFAGYYFSFKTLGKEMFAADLFKTVPRLEIPVYFLEGAHDRAVPAELVERYAEALGARHKEILWFEDSGHWPHLEEPEKFVTVMIGKVLGENQPAEEETAEPKSE